MTTKKITEAENRAKAASEGPISVHDSGWQVEGGDKLKYLSCMARQGALYPEDAELFAHAKEDILALTSYVAELEAGNKTVSRASLQLADQVVKAEGRVAELEALLPLLVKVAAREQRYACVDILNNAPRSTWDESLVQNAPAPDFEKVMETALKWAKESK